MSFKSILEKAKAKGEAFAAQHNFQIPGQSTTHTPPPPQPAPQGYYPPPPAQAPSQAHHHGGAPPPIPQNRPSYSAIHPYWTPSFSPHTHVSDNFRHQLGDHGWGNNELQNYVADRENSFHDEHGCLVLRAISSNGRFHKRAFNEPHDSCPRPRKSRRIDYTTLCIWHLAGFLVITPRTIYLA
ncbi:hypothetical protein DID88_004901 [Monilinia fructigena]|uniref:Uncharacterized protein n=1 Tax=Monilinia fructigena TaxID=38457 RepID=A0A395IPU8_9HELO|nr:hypothetical protein DID88_004901 [Monilinia fructigena]